MSPKRKANIQTEIDNVDVKKVRNRVSQQAFRRRKSEYIKQLEKRAKANMPENERILELENENRTLRQKLVECHTCLERLRATISGFTVSISELLDGPDEVSVSSSKLHVVDDLLVEEADARTTAEKNAAAETAALYSPVTKQIEDLARIDVDQIRNFEPFIEQDSFSLSSEARREPVPAATPSMSEIPNIWTYSYQMGPQSYWSALSGSKAVSDCLNREWISSNSPFSEHVVALKGMVRGKWEAIGESPASHPDLFYQSVSMVLSAFHSVSRPGAMTWYAKCRFSYTVDLIISQLCPSPQTLQRVHPFYRLTPLQIHYLESYPAIIDWIPFPSLRDKFILLHSANPLIDNIFCDAISGYVVQASMCDLVADTTSLPVYVRVLDLIAAMDPQSALVTSFKSGEVSSVKLPAPSVEKIFESPEFARLVFQKLEMDQGPSNYKMDPAFFQKYPELYDPAVNIMAHGVPVRPDVQTILPQPRPLDRITLKAYRDFTDFSTDMLWNCNRK